jgi:hypothetical protein|tara:strand:- start:662 stop:841 length:180 start_codon:yes stop_codon:yes gene_type:complete
MKSKLLTYALVFSILLIVFQYVNSKQIIDKYEVDIKKCKNVNEKLEIENFMLKSQLAKD